MRVKRVNDKRKRIQKPQKFSDEKKVVVKSLVDAGVAQATAARIMNMSRSMVTKIMHEFESDAPIVAWYKENRANVLAQAQFDNLALQSAIRDTITEEDLAKWTPDQRARWYQVLGVNFGIEYDKEQIERGKGVDDVGKVVDLIMKVKQIEAMQAEQGESSGD